MKREIFLIIFFILLISSIAFSGDYIIGDGDVLNISVWDNKDLTITVKVRPDGKLTIPALGDVAASGKTSQELQEEIRDKLKALVKNPVVTVIVTEINNNKAFIFGGGSKGGVFAIEQRTTLLQLLCMIGSGSASQAGVTATGSVTGYDAADLERAYVMRNGRTIKSDFRKLFLNGDLSEDIVIQPNDFIFIPPLVERNVYIIGAVNAPKFLLYREGMTVLEAILSAGGFTKFARENSTVVYRKNGGEKTEIPVKLKRLIDDGDLSQNVILKPGDYIVVSEGIF